MAGSNTLDWIETLDAFEVDWSAPIVVAGSDAAAFAAELSRRSAAGIAADGEDWALLGPDVPGTAPASWMDLPRGIAGTVIIRRAWADGPGLAAAAPAAARLVADGGRLVLADLDVDRLLTGPPVRYPYQFRFTLDPAGAAALVASTTSTADLALEVGRAGMRSVKGIIVDEERGVFPAAADYWGAVRNGAWASLGELAAEDRTILLENLAVALSRTAPMGEIVERRPWFAATGIRA